MNTLKKPNERLVIHTRKFDSYKYANLETYDKFAERERNKTVFDNQLDIPFDMYFNRDDLVDYSNKYDGQIDGWCCLYNDKKDLLFTIEGVDVVSDIAKLIQDGWDVNNYGEYIGYIRVLFSSKCDIIDNIKYTKHKECKSPRDLRILELYKKEYSPKYGCLSSDDNLYCKLNYTYGFDTEFDLDFSVNVSADYLLNSKVDKRDDKRGLYFLFDEKMNLLYVGISSNVIKRVREHLYNKSKKDNFSADITHVKIMYKRDIEKFLKKHPDCNDVEDYLIENLNPKHNKRKSNNISSFVFSD